MKKPFYDYVSDGIALFSEIVCGVMLTTVSSVLFVNVVGRYVFRHSFPWAEELSRYLVIWITMMVSNILIKNNELICVDFFDIFWPKRLIRYRNFSYRVLMVFMFVILIYQGWHMALDGRIAKVTSLRISWFWPYLAIPVGFSLMLIQLLIVMYKDLTQAGRD